MYCANCGTKLDKAVKFCRNCGKPVKSATEVIEEITAAFRKRQFDGLADRLKAIESDLEPGFFNKLKGDLFFVKGNYREANEYYHKLPKKDIPWDARFNMALIDLSANRPDDAITHLQLITEMDFDLKDSLVYSELYKDKKALFKDIYLYLGVLYRNLDDIGKSVTAFEKVLQFDPGNELANANLGDIMFKDDNYDAAIKYYKLAAASGSDDMKKSHLFNDLGLAYFRKGLTDEAIGSFKSAIILNAQNKNAVYNLGLIYVKSGMQDRVKDDYKEFLKHESGVDIVFNLTRSIMDVAKQENAGDMDMDFIGTDDSIKKVKEIIWKAAANDSTVFIHGENGTGKELAARAIHRMSKRTDKPFIVVNCGALPETLLESELFGYEKGAFTGAVKEKPGRFELADTGTVFLDEIGDITQAMQVKLLRFVQQKEFERVGGTKTIKVNVRIITATNKDIKKLVEDGKFREDLYYRLYVLPLSMPPLRDRGRDIMLLADHFLKRFSEMNSKDFTGFSEEASRALNRYIWPGNVRQLENVIERIVTLHDGPEVGLEYLPDEITALAKSGRTGPDDVGVPDEKSRVLQALESEKFSKTNAAKKLGISRVALWKKMKKLHID
jgi:transcriptional regulator with PAS, ATPase and Fis domain